MYNIDNETNETPMSGADSFNYILGGSIMNTKGFTYNVGVHFATGWDTYSVIANSVSDARYKAIKRITEETNQTHIDCVKVYSHTTGKLLKEYSE